MGSLETLSLLDTVSRQADSIFTVLILVLGSSVWSWYLVTVLVTSLNIISVFLRINFYLLFLSTLTLNYLEQTFTVMHSRSLRVVLISS